MNKLLTLLLLATSMAVAIPPQLDDLLCHECDFCVSKALLREPMPLIDLYTYCDAYKQTTGRRVKIVDKNKTAPEEIPEELVSQLNLSDDNLPDIQGLTQELNNTKEELKVVNKHNKELERRLERNKLMVEEHLKTIEALENTINQLNERKPGAVFNGWVYDTGELKWTYISPSITPFIYNQDMGWLKYEPGTNPRVFYRYNDNSWIELE